MTRWRHLKRAASARPVPLQQEVGPLSEAYRMSLVVNGKKVEAEVAPGKTLLEFLREDLRLTGAKHGCGKGECGACTVLLDDEPVNACLILAVQAEGCSIRTIEGLEEKGNLHPVQQGFLEEGGVQCGFCTPGLILSGVALLEKNAHPSAGDIRHALEGNICRCTGYRKIVRSLERAAERMAEAEEAEPTKT